MRDLIVKLETLKDSKEWMKIIESLEKEMADNNEKLLNESSDAYEEYFTEGDLIRAELRYIESLKDIINVKDKETKEALLADLDKSIQRRQNRLLGKTHEYKLDCYDPEWVDYKQQDLWRMKNWWIECLRCLPEKLVEELKVKEWQVEEMKEAEVQEQIDALASLEDAGL